jgi:uridylate kinase
MEVVFLEPKYKRVILKLSGEALAGPQGFGIDNNTVDLVAKEIKGLVGLGVQVAVVIGGGNFWRGRSSEDMDRSTADYIGMMATVMNALGLQEAVERHEMQSRVMSAIEMRQISEPYIRRKAVRHLEKGRVVIFAAGTGNPFFSTDTAASLRAAEIEADIILLAKKVDAVYDSDPLENPNAISFDKLTFAQVLEKGLRVMDTTAITLCQENNIPIHVFGLKDTNNINRVIFGEEIGTLIREAF